LLLTVIVESTLLSLAGAQVLRPIDPSKKADVDMKSLSLGDAQFQTVTQPTRDQPAATLSKGTLSLQDIQEKQIDFQTLEKPTVEKPTLHQPNFTAKRIPVEINEASNKNLDHAKKKAPITNRQIRPFAPGGEQELKKQLNEPH